MLLIAGYDDDVPAGAFGEAVYVPAGVPVGLCESRGEFVEGRGRRSEATVQAEGTRLPCDASADRLPSCPPPGVALRRAPQEVSPGMCSESQAWMASAVVRE